MMIRHKFYRSVLAAAMTAAILAGTCPQSVFAEGPLSQVGSLSTEGKVSASFSEGDGGLTTAGSGGGTTVSLDLTENTIQFGGFPEAKDREESNSFDEGLSGTGTAGDAASLTPDEVRSLIDNAISARRDSVSLEGCGLSVPEVTGIVSDVLNANPDYFTVTGASAVLDAYGETGSLEIMYAAGADEKDAEYEAAVASVLSGVNPEWSDEQKLFFLHDQLTTHCQYDLGIYENPQNIKASSYTPYGALVLHVAVCQGYADAFTDLANRAGITTYTVTSMENDHAWNLVKLYDENDLEEFYYIDCTWDDPTTYLESGESIIHGHRPQYLCDHKNLLLSEAGMVATKPKSHKNSLSDWVLGNGEKICGLYNDDTYDETDWKNCGSPVVCLPDGMSILFLCRFDDSRKGLFCYEGHAEPSECVSAFESDKCMLSATSYRWHVPSILMIGDTLFMNDCDQIFALDPDNEYAGSQAYMLTDAEKEKGNICGMEAVGTDIRYDLGTDCYSDLTVHGSGQCSVENGVGSYVSLDRSCITFKGLEGSETVRVVKKRPSDEDVYFSSSDEEIAEVDDEGVVTPVGYGCVTITAVCGDAAAFCRVNVDTLWQEDFSYYISSNGDMHIQDYTGTASGITIPVSATIKGVTHPVTSVFLSDVKGISSLTLGNEEDEMVINDNMIIQYCTSLESVEFNDPDTTAMKNLSFFGSSALKTLDLTDIETDSVTDMGGMFQSCSSLESLDLSGWDLSLVTDMNSMFSGCKSLQNLKMENCSWNAEGSVTDMNHMFSGCSTLKELDLSDLVTEKVTDMSYMFSGCSALESLDLSSFDMSSVTSVNRMFSGCESLKGLDMGSVSAGAVTDMSYMINGCKSLTSIDMSGFDLSRLTAFTYVFGDCKALERIETPVNLSKEIGLPAEFTDAGGTKYSALPQGKSTSFTITRTVYMQELKVYEETGSGKNYYSSNDQISMNKGSVRTLVAEVIPANAVNNTTVTWESSDPQSVSVTQGTLTALKETDDYVKVTVSAVSGNTTLALDLYVKAGPASGISLSPVEITFEGTEGSRTLTATVTGGGDVEWSSTDEKVAKVSQEGVVTPVGYGKALIKASANGYEASCQVYVDTVWQKVFDLVTDSGRSSVSITGYHGASASVTIQPSATEKGDTYKVSSLSLTDNSTVETLKLASEVEISDSLILLNCTSLKTFDLNKADTKGMKTFSFKGCSAIKSLDLSGLDTGNVTSLKSAFSGCSSLGSLDLKGWNTEKVADISYMFRGCRSLKTLDLSSFVLAYDFGSSACDSVFEGCSSLAGLEAPLGVVTNISLPADFIDGDGNIFGKLPLNLTGSMHLDRAVYAESVEICEWYGYVMRVYEPYDIIEMEKGETRTLSVNVLPETAFSKAVVWSSEDPSAVSVDQNGLLTALKENGQKVLITASAVGAKDPVKGYLYVQLPEDKDITPPETGIAIEGLEDSYYYTGAKITPHFEVVDHDIEGGVTLSKGVDYTVKCRDNKIVGKNAQVIVTGKGNYAGLSITKTFGIVENRVIEEKDLLDLTGMKIGAIAPLTYTGEPLYPGITVTFKGGASMDLTYNESGSVYVAPNGNEFRANVAFSNNTDRGTATLALTGAKNAKGKPTVVKKTFRINPAGLSGGSGRTVVEADDTDYAVKGAVPGKLRIICGGKELLQGQDYTVKYGANKKAAQGVLITVTGKGNYKGKVTGRYNIARLDLGDLCINAVSAKDGIRAGKVKALILDRSGDPLKASQYRLEVMRKDQENYDPDLVLHSGDEIAVRAVAATGDQNLYGMTAVAYFTVGTDISRTKGKIGCQKTYTGSPVLLEEGDILLSLKGQLSPLLMDKDFEIAGYSHNVNKGMAVVYLRGIGTYGGYCQMKFSIDGKASSAN